MFNKQKEITRRGFLSVGTQTAAGIVTAAALTSSAVKAEKKNLSYWNNWA